MEAAIVIIGGCSEDVDKRAVDSCRSCTCKLPSSVSYSTSPHPSTGQPKTGQNWSGIWAQILHYQLEMVLKKKKKREEKSTPKFLSLLKCSKLCLAISFVAVNPPSQCTSCQQVPFGQISFFPPEKFSMHTDGTQMYIL